MSTFPTPAPATYWQTIEGQTEILLAPQIAVQFAGYSNPRGLNFQRIRLATREDKKRMARAITGFVSIPTVPGFYWILTAGLGDNTPHVAELRLMEYQEGDEMELWLTGNDWGEDMDFFRQYVVDWRGPLESPFT